jgi:hypothetical protein
MMVVGNKHNVVADYGCGEDIDNYYDEGDLGYDGNDTEEYGVADCTDWDEDSDNDETGQDDPNEEFVQPDEPECLNTDREEILASGEESKQVVIDPGDTFYEVSVSGETVAGNEADLGFIKSDLECLQFTHCVGGELDEVTKQLGDAGHAATEQLGNMELSGKAELPNLVPWYSLVGQCLQWCVLHWSGALVVRGGHPPPRLTVASLSFCHPLRES